MAILELIFFQEMSNKIGGGESLVYSYKQTN